MTSIIDLKSFFVDLEFDLIVYLIIYLDRLPQSFFVNLKFFFVDLIVNLVVDLRSGSGSIWFDFEVIFNLREGVVSMGNFKVYYN